ncbi:hypothetical protein EKN06_04855 [Croceicoccus ponticola]|uniref:WYL domain-containing protein n=1 Tax=Croceicoccus ponticola TaxID=2217664 RepID=A0A437H1J0_9SPHN|nr:hypothetical protein [Croceicoccus ponticola]RVQ69501.1 hypothetical protein EKN06_04855 [Croceicoccus ponticola]
MHNNAESEPPVERKFIEGIARKLLMEAVYNGEKMVLAPHQLFTRNDALFVSALNTTRNWRSPEERRVGHFKLQGLSNVALTEQSFEPLPTFDDSPAREGDKQLFSV